MWWQKDSNGEGQGASGGWEGVRLRIGDRDWRGEGRDGGVRPAWMWTETDRSRKMAKRRER